MEAIRILNNKDISILPVKNNAGRRQSDNKNVENAAEVTITVSPSLPSFGRSSTDECNKELINDEEENDEQAIEQFITPDIEIKEEEWFQCDECNKSFCDLNRLDSHKFIHKRLFKCDICDKSYFQLNELNKHKKAHFSESSDVCDRCADSDRLTREQLEIRKEELIKCSICRKDFFHLRCLNLHIKLFHAGEKPFACSVCEKCFVRPNYVRAHQKLHVEKPFACEECNRCFFEISQLETHEKVHPKEKRYKCDFCKKRFSEIHNFRKHEKIHNGCFTLIKPDP